ncbi:thioredoxin [Candidatus Parcubacteria bacterium]|nr:thioredoxin [Patescibacteria group bacterium]MBU4309651.1 thioredoxin [Patescibacteria group bacterium]MBU4432027.1 thioredoxin [Patescibacteria group bacterium]MBU4577961.1 thioredoxin [Patescibacteria group bacterium]MCG2696530.1 thioredoxin [Candidatus Parcubacteria bacterium]
MSKALDLTNENFETEVLKSDIPVLVDFWAPWCGPCRMMAPVLDELSGEMSGKVKIAKLDVENPNHQQLAMQYQIQSIPNMKLFKGGQVIGDFVGARPKDALKADIESRIK